MRPARPPIKGVTSAGEAGERASGRAGERASGASGAGLPSQSVVAMRRAQLSRGPAPALATLAVLAALAVLSCVLAGGGGPGGRCVCTADTLECKGRNKTVVLADELCGRQVDKWELSRNRLSQLHFLPSPCHVAVLDVAFNRIQELHGPLQTCGDLFMLILSGNPLRALPDAAFQGMPHLSYLELDGAGIVTLSTNTFAGLSALYSLNLRGNHLAMLPERVFSSLNRLSFLDISENQIKIFPDNLFVGLGELRFLNASSNNLVRLQRGLFEDTQQLLGLNLSSNELSTLDEDLFVGLVHLRRLEVQGNRLTQVPLLQECCLHAHLVDLSRNNISAPDARRLRALLRLSHRLESDVRSNPVSRHALCAVLRAAGAGGVGACEAKGRCLCGRLRSCREPRECWPVVHLCEDACAADYEEWAWKKTDEDDDEKEATGFTSVTK
ncbi:hypothetical protein R5R35_009341 [Gryllus longicercus]|uniref:Uncharacterized protein n=1 Tax=Gryllus longicercus TaxID=2509291 RepID=A0AAN9W390_9ORTH